MSNPFLPVQYFGLGLLALETLYILRQRKSVLQTLLSLLVISILINMVGYTLELQATNLQLAIQAVKVSYLGKPFIILCMLLFVLEYCGIQLPIWLRGMMVMIAVSIFLLVFTCTSHTLFYSSIDFTEDGLFPHLVLGHGIFYNLYTGVIVAYILLILLVCFRRYRNVSDPKIKRQLLYLVAISLIGASGLVLFLLRLTGGYDATLICYMISASLFTLMLRRYRTFDALTIAKEEAIAHLSDGLIVLNEYHDIVYVNEKAKQIAQDMDREKYPAAESSKGKVTIMEALSAKGQPLFLHCNCKEDHAPCREEEACVFGVSAMDIVCDGNNYGRMITLSDISDSYYYTARLQKEVQKKTHELLEIQREIISSLATMMEARDKITGLHVKNTGLFVKILVDAMKNDSRFTSVISDDFAAMIADAAYLHDIGKIAIPDAVLQKNGRLSEEEFAKIKNHPVEGASIIEETLRGLETDDYIQIALDMALYHHEKYDGTGYPAGLRGETIPLSARIMAVADVYEALRAPRHYKPAMPMEKAVAIMKESKGTHFDADITDIFLEHIEEIEAALETA